MRIVVTEHPVIGFVILARKEPAHQRIRRNHDHRILLDVLRHRLHRCNLVPQRIAKHPVERIRDIVVKPLVINHANAVAYAIAVAVEHPAVPRIGHRRLFQVDVFPCKRIAHRNTANRERSVHYVGRTHHVEFRKARPVRLDARHLLIVLVEEHQRIRCR